VGIDNGYFRLTLPYGSGLDMEVRDQEKNATKRRRE
jgi:hypothetical protein